MPANRLLILTVLCAATLAPAQSATTTPIDRHALITRHNIEVHTLDPNGAMAVGNGHFAFNFDVTGLQSFPDYYAKTMPLGILSDWGWHSFPNPNGYSIDNFPMTVIPKYNRQFVFPSASTSHPTPAAAYLRENPNRFGLGRIGLDMTHADGSQGPHHRPARHRRTPRSMDRHPHQFLHRRWHARPRRDHSRAGTKRGCRSHRFAAHRLRPPQAPHRLPLRF